MNEDYKYESKAEYELVYKGKEPKASVLTNTLAAPLQEMRVFNEDNPWEDGWQNMLLFGDNLMALKTLYDDIKEGGSNKFDLRNKIKLIYIDPPFATKQDFMKDKEKAYRDKVIGAQFIEFIRKRLIFLKEILADDGSIYVHLDQKKGHYIKTALDEILGEHNYQNEIVWKRTSAHSDAGKYGMNCDFIYFYTKGEKYIWNQGYENYDEKYLKRFKNIDPDGRRWQDGPITAKGLSGGGYEYEYKGVNGLWRCPLTTMERLDNENMLYFTNKGGIRIKRYLDTSKGIPYQTLWSDIYPANSQAVERVNYPTQKPENLLERIINVSSNEGDIVLDCFAGSGSLPAVAEKMNRKWISIDCGKLSIYTQQKRLVELTDKIGSPKKDERLQLDRIENKKEMESSKGLFFISEKAKKGQLNVTDDFLFKLHSFLLELSVDEFSLVCPEDKFQITNYEEDEDGNKTFKRDHISYKISFIEPKSKIPKLKSRKAKSFVLYHAGVYDKEGILNLQWDAYLDFVMQLFEVRSHPHEISGFACNGYIGVYSAYIWEYPLKRQTSLDEEWVNTLHKQIKGKAGERMYVIVPSNAIDFLQNDIKIDDTIYTFLKVPVSVLVRLIQSYKNGDRDYKASFKQPKGKEDVNQVIDAFGFDFISQPVIEYELVNSKITDGMFSEDTFVIRLKDFRSNGLLYSPEEFEPFETLSLVLIDYNFSAEPFTMDEYQWGNDLVKADSVEVDIPLMASKWVKDKVAVILIDVYGNEKTMVLNKNDFK